MEPKRQVEIQLGHMCNNRCVFCVSGQQTAFGRVRPLDEDPILARIDEAFAQGHRKLTILGGEPTLQPSFLNVVRHAVALGFEEIVLFTNGVKTARASFIDEVLQTGGRFNWRISIQGATKEAHERTTKKPGSFDRIVKTMEHLRARGQTITVNMCVVSSNYESVAHFPELLLPFGVKQLHLDMMRPLDAGERSEAEMREMLPRYSEMVPALERMIAGFPEGFDVNIGNLPFCMAPHLARFIHHDGEKTHTIAVDGENELSRPWDKYEVKRRDKLKIPSCRDCVFEPRCSGIFETYRAFYGTSELQPISAERLRTLDPERRLLALHLAPLVREVLSEPLSPFERVTIAERNDAELFVTLSIPNRKRLPMASAQDAPSDEPALRLLFHAPKNGLVSFEDFGISLAAVPKDVELAKKGLHALVDRLVAHGQKLLHPIADDVLSGASPLLTARLTRLRKAAPFGELAWTDLAIGEGGRRAELSLRGPAGERAMLWLGEQAGRPVGGYRLEGEATEAVVSGLRAAMGALQRG